MTYLNGIVHSRRKTEKKFFFFSTRQRVWQQLEYRIDVCRVTRGAHIEHL
jgi:hypothetical protein